MLFVHGAGTSSKDRCLPLARRLASEFGVSSFAFDFSGHGKSTGTLKGSSLGKRTTETLAALDYAQLDGHASICSFSMGGHVALEVARNREFGSLIFFYPAVYSRDAAKLPFSNPAFTAILHSPESWKRNDVIPVMERFAGSVLIVVGQNDEVIPSEVIKRLFESAVRAKRRRLVVVPNAPHLLLKTLAADEGLYSEVCQTIADYSITQ